MSVVVQKQTKQLLRSSVGILFSCTLGDQSSEGFIVMVVVANASARAVLGGGVDRMRNCIVPYLSETLTKNKHINKSKIHKKMPRRPLLS